MTQTVDLDLTDIDLAALLPALRSEAGEAGDLAGVARCDAAMGGDQVAARACAAQIVEAAVRAAEGDVEAAVADLRARVRAV